MASMRRCTDSTELSIVVPERGRPTSPITLCSPSTRLRLLDCRRRLTKRRIPIIAILEYRYLGSAASRRMRGGLTGLGWPRRYVARVATASGTGRATRGAAVRFGNFLFLDK